MSGKIYGILVSPSGARAIELRLEHVFNLLGPHPHESFCLEMVRRGIHGNVGVKIDATLC